MKREDNFQTAPPKKNGLQSKVFLRILKIAKHRSLGWLPRTPSGRGRPTPTAVDLNGAVPEAAQILHLRDVGPITADHKVTRQVPTSPLRAYARIVERFAMALQDHTHCNEIIWGAEAMGVVIGLSKRKVFNLLDNNLLKGAKKIGRRWCITRQNLLANFDPSTTTDDEES